MEQTEKGSIARGCLCVPRSVYTAAVEKRPLVTLRAYAVRAVARVVRVDLVHLESFGLIMFSLCKHSLVKELFSIDPTSVEKWAKKFVTR